MVAMVVMAILATVALPSYQNHMQEARRADAYSCLMDVAQRQENFFYQNNRYSTNTGELGLANTNCGGSGHYNLELAAGPTGSINTSYELTARRLSAAQQDDTRCGDFTLDSAGAKGNDNASLPASECW
jgi:type IV pilus assembly protein PilE